MSSPGVSPDLMRKVAEWRAKIADGSITLNEMREGIAYLREDREKAVAAARPAKKSSTRPARPVEDLLADFENS